MTNGVIEIIDSQMKWNEQQRDSKPEGEMLRAFVNFHSTLIFPFYSCFTAPGHF